MKPGSSALVESESRRRIPSVRASSPMRDRSVRRPSTGCQVELEVARVQDHALGRVERDGHRLGDRVGDGDELDVDAADLAPSRRRVTGDEAGPIGQPGLVDPVPGQTDGQLRAVDRGLQLAQQVGQAPRVVLVPVGEDDPVDPVACGRAGR